MPAADTALGAVGIGQVAAPEDEVGIVPHCRTVGLGQVLGPVHRVAADGDQTKVEWQGTFDAKGASDDDAKKVVSGIYETGLASIAKPAGN